MKVTHLLTVTALALGGVTAAAAPVQAAPLADVLVVEGGAPCPVGYGEIVQLDQTTVCYDVNVPYYKLVTDGKPCNSSYGDNYTEYSVLDYVRVCLKWQ